MKHNSEVPLLVHVTIFQHTRKEASCKIDMKFTI
jgi:hypothetical protein